MPLALPAEGSGITISDLCVLNNPPITLVKMIFVFLLVFFLLLLQLCLHYTISLSRHERVCLTTIMFIIF